MIYLYDSTETDFRYNGKPLPTAYDVTVSNTLNSEYYVMGKYPLDKNKVYKELVEDRIIKVHTMDGMQPFRIVNVSKYELYVEFEAWPLFYADMRNKLVKPLTLKGVSGQVALSSFKNNLLIDTPFDFYSDITDNHDYHTQDKNERENNPKQLYNALDVFKTIVSRWGGELWIRGYDVRVNKRIGTDTEAMLYEKKNITEFVDTTNIEGIVTRLHGKSEWQDEPKEGEEEGQKHSIETTVNSPLINNYSGVVFEKQFTNNAIRTEQALKNWLNLKFTTENIDKPQRTIEVGTNVIDDTKIGFADTLILKYIKHDTDVRIKVVGYEYDGFANELKHVVLGQPKHTSSSTIGNTITDLVNNVVEPVDRKTTIAMSSADGKSTVFHGTADPNTLNLNAKENDTYFRTNGSEKEIWRFTGTLWEKEIDTSDTTKNADAIKEQQKLIDEAKEVADEAVEQIDTAVSNAGFTSLDDTLQNMNDITMNAEQSAQQAITDASNAFSAAQSALSGLDDKVDTSVYNATLLDLEADIDSAITAGNTAKETAEGLITQVGDIGSVANSAKQDAEDAVSTANAAKTSADNLTTEVSGLKTDVEGFELTVNDYQDQVSQFSADVDGFQSTVASYETEVDEFGNIVSTNTTQVNELRNDIDGFESLLASYDEDLTGFNTTVSSFRNTLEGLESTVASYETEVDEYGNEVATYATELSTLRNTVNGFESTVAEFDTTVTGYQSSLATLTNTVDGFESTVANYEVQVDEYGNAVSSYATEVATLENTVDGFNSLVASFEKEAEGYSAEVSEFRNTVSGLQSTVARYEVELDEYGNTVDSYATQVATFNNTVDGLESSVAAYEQSVSGYATQLATLTNTVDGFNSTVTSYETQLDEYGVEVSQYATEVSTLNNTVSGFQSKVTKVEQDYAGVSETVATHTSQISNINGQIALKANTSTVNALTGRVNTAETGITANATAIGLKASQSSVDTLTGTVSTLSGRVDVTAGQISSKVWNTDIQTAVDGIEVGGRNLIPNSKGNIFTARENVNVVRGKLVDVPEWGTANAVYLNLHGNNNSLLKAIGPHYVVPIEGEYTFSMRVKNAGVSYFDVELLGGDSVRILPGESKRVELTSLCDKGDDVHPKLISQAIMHRIEIIYFEPKLEKGNKATDWTPAPEDTDAKIEHIETEWTQTFDTFSQTVSGIDGRVTEQKQTIDNISSTVYDEHSGRISEVEQIAEGLQTTVADKASQSQVTQLSNLVDTKVTSSQVNTLIKTDKTIKDTRNDNEDPTWYQSNYSRETVRELKNSSIMGISGEGGFGLLETIVPWSNTSGGGIKQTLTTDHAVYERSGLSTTWSEWRKTADVDWVGSQISVLEDNINLRVTKGELLSQINIEAGQTLIQSNKLYLDAESVVFSGKAFIPSAVIESLTADKMTTGTLNAANVSIINLDAHNIATGTLRGIRVEADEGLIGGWNLDSGGLYKQTPYGYTTLKPDGDVAIGIASPQHSYTTGAALQIWHDGTLRFGNTANKIYGDSSANLVFEAHNWIYLKPRATVFVDGKIVPWSNIAGSVGDSDYRWWRMYSEGYHIGDSRGGIQGGSGSEDGAKSIEVFSGGSLLLKSINRDIYSQGSLYPYYRSNTYYLGSSGYRWQGVYLTSQPNVSSDMRDKKLIQDIPQGLIDNLKEIQPKMYQQKDEWHFGYIAQDVERAIYRYVTSMKKWDNMEDMNEYARSFAMLHKDESKLSLLYGEIAVIKEVEMQERMDRLENKLEELLNAN